MITIFIIIFDSFLIFFSELQEINQPHNNMCVFYCKGRFTKGTLNTQPPFLPQCLCSSSSSARKAFPLFVPMLLFIKAKFKIHLFAEIRLEKSTRLAVRRSSCMRFAITWDIWAHFSNCKIKISTDQFKIQVLGIS